MEKLVSVIIPVYNRQETILRAVNSVLTQTYTNIEVIIVDDGSSDNTMEILKNYSDPRIRILFQNHKGACVARNRGIYEAKGEYIAFQDSDDEWLSVKLERQIAFMKKNKVKVSFCSYKLYAEKEYIIPIDYLPLSSSQIKEILREGNIVGTPTLIVEKEVLNQIGCFNEKLPALEDYELAIRITKKYSIGYLNEVLVNAYRMDQCITNDSNSANQAIIMILSWHKDFLDIKTHLKGFFSREIISNDKNLSWKEVDNLLTAVCESFEEREYVYRILVEYMYDKQRKAINNINILYDQFEKQLAHKKFVIFGAGIIGKRTYERLKLKGLLPKYFVVTAIENEETIDSIPIIEFNQFKKNPLPIIVAVSDRYQSDVLEYIQKEKNFSYIISPESIK